MSQQFLIHMVKGVRALRAEAVEVVIEKSGRSLDDLREGFAAATGVRLLPDRVVVDLYGTPNNVSYGDTCFEVVSRSSQAILGLGHDLESGLDLG